MTTTALATYPTAAGTSAGARAVAFARAQIGKPYVWGAEGPDAYDCSGLTMAAWASAGVQLPRTTSGQILVGTAVPSRAQLAPGDLVFTTRGHVVLYAGAGRVVSAPYPGRTVHEYTLGPYLLARRPVASSGNPLATAVDTVAGTIKGATTTVTDLLDPRQITDGVQAAGVKLLAVGAGLLLVVLGVARVTGAHR